MDQAKSGDRVRVHYTGRLNDESVFDTSEGRDPLTFQLGKGQVVPGFDRAVKGMEVGEKKTVTISATDAYGPRIDQLVFTAPRKNLPPGHDPQVGEVVGLETREGHQLEAVVVQADADVIRMDGNHPLAGQDLTFDIELVGIG